MNCGLGYNGNGRVDWNNTVKKHFYRELQSIMDRDIREMKELTQIVVFIDKVRLVMEKQTIQLCKFLFTWDS